MEQKQIRYVEPQHLKVVSQMTKVFNNRIEFFDAITLAEKHIFNGQDVPTELWDKIQQTRQDYSSYRKG